MSHKDRNNEVSKFWDQTEVGLKSTSAGSSCVILNKLTSASQVPRLKVCITTVQLVNNNLTKQTRHTIISVYRTQHSRVPTSERFLSLTATVSIFISSHWDTFEREEVVMITIETTVTTEIRSMLALSVSLILSVNTTSTRDTCPHRQWHLGVLCGTLETRHLC